jgi:hypothetical protein
LCRPSPILYIEPERLGSGLPAAEWVLPSVATPGVPRLLPPAGSAVVGALLRRPLAERIFIAAAAAAAAPR